MNKADNTLLFYRGEELSLIKKDTQTFNLLRAEGQLLAERTAGASDDLYLLTTDTSSSVLRIATERNTEQHAYSAYGYTPAHPSRQPQLAFNGELLNNSTHSYLLGAGTRLFSPTLMRFYSPDSISPFSLAGLNAYAYCLNDPVNYSDPTGHIGVKASVERYKLRTNAQHRPQPRKLTNEEKNYLSTNRKLNIAVHATEKAQRGVNTAVHKLQRSYKNRDELELQHNRIPPPDNSHWHDKTRYEKQVLASLQDIDISESEIKRDLSLLRDAEARLLTAQHNRDAAMVDEAAAWHVYENNETIRSKHPTFRKNPKNTIK